MPLVRTYPDILSRHNVRINGAKGAFPPLPGHNPDIRAVRKTPPYFLQIRAARVMHHHPLYSQPYTQRASRQAGGRQGKESQGQAGLAGIQQQKHPGSNPQGGAVCSKGERDGAAGVFYPAPSPATACRPAWGTPRLFLSPPARATRASTPAQPGTATTTPAPARAKSRQ